MARSLAEQLLSGVGQRWGPHRGGGPARRGGRGHGRPPGPIGARGGRLAARHRLQPGGGRDGLHSLDGARYLLRPDGPLASARSSPITRGARFLADCLGLGEALRVFPDEDSAVSDALVYADQTTGPDGERQPMLARITESVARHGPNSPQALIHAERSPTSCRRPPGGATPAGADRLLASLIRLGGSHRRREPDTRCASYAGAHRRATRFTSSSCSSCSSCRSSCSSSP